MISRTETQTKRRFSFLSRTRLELDLRFHFFVGRTRIETISILLKEPKSELLHKSQEPPNTNMYMITHQEPPNTSMYMIIHQIPYYYVSAHTRLVLPHCRNPTGMFFNTNTHTSILKVHSHLVLRTLVLSPLTPS
jgi:hypothetical protein